MNSMTSEPAETGGPQAGGSLLVAAVVHRVPSRQLVNQRYTRGINIIFWRNSARPSQAGLHIGARFQ
jgi:hypothetical protein